MDFSHLPTFTVTGDDSQEYGELVDKTSKLLKRRYIVIHNIFTREKWSLNEIRQTYILATKHNGDMPSSVYWWWKRKQRIQKHTTDHR